MRSGAQSFTFCSVVERPGPTVDRGGVTVVAALVQDRQNLGREAGHDRRTNVGGGWRADIWLDAQATAPTAKDQEQPKRHG